MMLSELDQSNYSIHTHDDFSSCLLHLHSDNILLSESDVLTSLMEDRDSISSSCPSISSDCGVDFLPSDELDIFSLDRLEPQTPLSPCKQPEDVNSPSKIFKSRTFSASKRWSSLSVERQSEVLEDLMEEVSTKLGLREQLEVISIINPSAKLNQTDTEFFVDFELVDDKKFELVSRYVTQELAEQTRKSEKSKTTKQVSRRHERVEKLKNRRPNNQKHSKLGKQVRKERKSGLFSREQVIAVASFNQTEPDEEEIDILS